MIFTRPAILFLNRQPGQETKKKRAVRTALFLKPARVARSAPVAQRSCGKGLSSISRRLRTSLRRFIAGPVSCSTCSRRRAPILARSRRATPRVSSDERGRSTSSTALSADAKRLDRTRFCRLLANLVHLPTGYAAAASARAGFLRPGDRFWPMITRFKGFCARPFQKKACPLHSLPGWPGADACAYRRCGGILGNGAKSAPMIALGHRPFIRLLRNDAKP